MPGSHKNDVADISLETERAMPRLTCLELRPVATQHSATHERRLYDVCALR